MSGKIILEKWYENADMQCTRCHSNIVWEYDTVGHPYFCPNCGPLKEADVTECDGRFLPSVRVVRCDQDDKSRGPVFESQVVAEAALLTKGISAEELEQDFQFLDVVPKKAWKIPVTWTVCGEATVEAETLEDAMEIVDQNPDNIKLPQESEYVDASFQLTYSLDEAEIVRAFHDQ